MTRGVSPGWFARLVAVATNLYPGLVVNTGTIDAWYRYLHDLPEEAIRLGFRRAIKASPDRMPSVVRIREHAEACSKSLSHLPALDLKALPEPSPELPEDNPLHGTLEKFKRGPPSDAIEAAKLIISALSDGMKQK